MLISVLIVTQLLLHGVIGDIHNVCPTPQDEKKKCYREECLQLANDILEKMDITTSPCRNFYQYACGGWLERQFLRPNRKRVTTSVNNLPWALIRKFLAGAPEPTNLVAVQKAKAFYASCVNFATVTPSESANSVMLQTNGSYRYDVDWFLFPHQVHYNIEKSLVDAIRLGVYPLFELRADPNSFTKRQSRSHLYVGKPVRWVPYDRYKFLRDDTLRLAYVEKLMSIHGLFIQRDDVREFTLRYIESEVAIATMYNDLTNTGTVVNMTLEQMNTEFPFLNWTSFVSRLVSSPDVGIADITPHEIVIVSDPEYLRAIFHHITGLEIRQQFAHFYTRVYESLQYAILDEDEKWDLRIDGNGTLDNLLQRIELNCVKQTSQLFDLVVHRFLFRTLENDAIRKVQDINRKMTLRFAGIVNMLDWLSNDTKDTIVDKVLSMETVISFHANAMNDSLLESYYSNITVDQQFIRNIARARFAAFVRDIRNIRRTREVDPPSFPHEFVAEYSGQLNKIFINPIVLREPFYMDGYKSLNFASAGIALAQEMMRGFDTQGIRYNKDGVEGNWLTDSEVQDFNARVQCLVEQYNNYTYGPAGMRVNGTLTLDSNIADVTGLKLAYQAYSSYHAEGYDLLLLPGVPLTSEQLFFVRFAQMQCTKESGEAVNATLSGRKSPDEFRVNGPLRNLEEFSTAFGCPEDSYMNPPNKCVVW